MKAGFDYSQPASQQRLTPFDPPAFIVYPEPWYRTFTGNLVDLIWTRSRHRIVANPSAPFWHDVFVNSAPPWGRFAESLVFHSAVIAVLWSSAQIWPQRPHLVQPATFDKSDVISYAASEYLAPLDTGSSSPALAQKGDPVYAPQQIISVPAESDNRRQTIVTPPALKLAQDVTVPNVMNWSRPAPTIPVPPIAAQASDRRLPALPQTAVAPAPEISGSNLNPAPLLSTSVVAPAPEVTREKTRHAADLPQAAIVQPPPGIELASMRKAGEIAIGHTEVVAPAPELPVDEQHAAFSRQSLGSSPAVVPPPPSLQPGAASRSEGRVIALSMNPAPPSSAVEIPNGNRRGTFSATPAGKPSNSGTPDIDASQTQLGNATTPIGSGKSLNGVPTGLLVGAPPKLQATAPVSGIPSAEDPKPATGSSLIAKAMPPRTVASELSAAQETESDRKIFGARKSYAMTVNLPNLNSAGGSLVMHFSELREEQKQGDLFAPVITQAAAPGYPLELMRENVQGTVELSAVIHSDGSVRDITFLNDVDERLQALAREALLRWRFLPALRNGNPVPLQAVVKIPFKARTIRF